MRSLLRQVLSTWLVLLLVLVCLTPAGMPDASVVAGATAATASAVHDSFPDGLMSALLDASAQPFTLGAEGYQARAGGLLFILHSDGLQATAGGLAWRLSLSGFGRGQQPAPLPEAEIVQADARLESLRGPLTEWYRDTALGLEQGFTIHRAPAGTGFLVLQLNVSGSLAGMPDADGRGLTLVAPDGERLRYDHLHAWDAHGVSLDARLLYRDDQVLLQVDDRGAAYPLTVDPLVYVEQKVLDPGGGLDYFGSSVAVDGDTALVGMPGDDAEQGSAYVFVRSGTAWSLQQRLTASDGAAGDEFGTAVALAGDTALVGAPGDDVGANTHQGSACVFVRSGTAWSQQQQLTASAGGPADSFGASVSIEGDTALVGAPNANVFLSDDGSAYAFVRSGTTWSEQATLGGSGAQGAHFGSSVAFSDDTALVGAPGDPTDGNAGQGAAYIYSRWGTVWTMAFTLTAFDGAEDDNFGAAVALGTGGTSPNTFLVGAPGDDVGSNVDQGSAYVFIQQGSYCTLQQHLTAVDGAANDSFGAAVALDGETALVGAYADDVGANSYQGSAYVFVRSGTDWSQQQQLVASDGAAFDYFGAAVALSGETALLGAPHDDVGANTNQGSAYVFIRSGTAWSQQAHLWVVPEDTAGDHFGNSVALDGDTAVIGVPNADHGAHAGQGAAYVFVRNGTTWSLQQALFAPDGATGDCFGTSVALSGDTAVVGAPSDDIWATDQGSVYVFTRSGTTWAMQQQLTAGDGIQGDRMGSSVALDGDTAMVGVPGDDLGAVVDVGTAFVFVRSGTVWSEQAHLSASDGADGDAFGYRVALSGDTALASAVTDEVGGNFWQGSAYVFVRSGTTWSEQAHLFAADGALGDFFGESVALEGDTALVGADGVDIGANGDQGMAYVFVRAGTTWSEQARLAALDGAAIDSFGYSVALDGDTALIGARHDAVGPNDAQGSAYVFLRSGTTWSEQGKITASDGAMGDFFGHAVVLSGDTALVGAPYDDVDTRADQGSAYFYDLTVRISFQVLLPLVVRNAPW